MRLRAIVPCVDMVQDRQDEQNERRRGPHEKTRRCDGQTDQQEDDDDGGGQNEAPLVRALTPDEAGQATPDLDINRFIRTRGAVFTGGRSSSGWSQRR